MRGLGAHIRRDLGQPELLWAFASLAVALVTPFLFTWDDTETWGLWRYAFILFPLALTPLASDLIGRETDEGRNTLFRLYGQGWHHRLGSQVVAVALVASGLFALALICSLALVARRPEPEFMVLWLRSGSAFLFVAATSALTGWTVGMVWRGPRAGLWGVTSAWALACWAAPRFGHRLVELMGTDAGRSWVVAMLHLSPVMWLQGRDVLGPATHPPPALSLAGPGLVLGGWMLLIAAMPSAGLAVNGQWWRGRRWLGLLLGGLALVSWFLAVAIFAPDPFGPAS